MLELYEKSSKTILKLDGRLDTREDSLEFTLGNDKFKVWEATEEQTTDGWTYTWDASGELAVDRPKWASIKNLGVIQALPDHIAKVGFRHNRMTIYEGSGQSIRLAVNDGISEQDGALPKNGRVRLKVVKQSGEKGSKDDVRIVYGQTEVGYNFEIPKGVAGPRFHFGGVEDDTYEPTEYLTLKLEAIDDGHAEGFYYIDPDNDRIRIEMREAQKLGVRFREGATGWSGVVQDSVIRLGEEYPVTHRMRIVVTDGLDEVPAERDIEFRVQVKEDIDRKEDKRAKPGYDFKPVDRMLTIPRGESYVDMDLDIYEDAWTEKYEYFDVILTPPNRRIMREISTQAMSFVGRISSLDKLDIRWDRESYSVVEGETIRPRLVITGMAWNPTTQTYMRGKGTYTRGEGGVDFDFRLSPSTILGSIPGICAKLYKEPKAPDLAEDGTFIYPEPDVVPDLPCAPTNDITKADARYVLGMSEEVDGGTYHLTEVQVKSGTITGTTYPVWLETFRDNIPENTEKIEIDLERLPGINSHTFLDSRRVPIYIIDQTDNISMNLNVFQEHAGLLRVTWNEIPTADYYLLRWQQKPFDCDMGWVSDTDGEQIWGIQGQCNWHEIRIGASSSREHRIDPERLGNPVRVQVGAYQRNTATPPPVEEGEDPIELLDIPLGTSEIVEIMPTRVSKVGDVRTVPGVEQVHLEWQPTPGATPESAPDSSVNYRVEWKSGSQGWHADRSKEVDCCHATIENLTAGTEYTIRVIGLEKIVGAEGLPSDPVTETPVAQTTPVPIDGFVVFLLEDGLSFKWKATGSSDGYQLEWREVGGEFSSERRVMVEDAARDNKSIRPLPGWNTQAFEARGRRKLGTLWSEWTTKRAVRAEGPVDPAEFALKVEGPIKVVEGDRIQTLTISLERTDGEEVVPVHVDLPLSVTITGSAEVGKDYEEIADTVTIAAGETSTELPIRIVNGNYEVEHDETIGIEIQYGGEELPTRITNLAATNHEIVIRDNDVVVARFKDLRYTIEEGETAQIKVTLASPNANSECLIAFPISIRYNIKGVNEGEALPPTADPTDPDYDIATAPTLVLVEDPETSGVPRERIDGKRVTLGQNKRVHLPGCTNEVTLEWESLEDSLVERQTETLAVVLHDDVEGHDPAGLRIETEALIIVEDDDKTEIYWTGTEEEIVTIDGVEKPIQVAAYETNENETLRLGWRVSEPIEFDHTFAPTMEEKLSTTSEKLWSQNFLTVGKYETSGEWTAAFGEVSGDQTIYIKLDNSSIISHEGVSTKEDIYAKVTVRDTSSPATAAPEAPSGMTVTKGDGEVTIEWEAPQESEGITGWEVRYGAANAEGPDFGEWSEIEDSTAETVSHTVTGLENGQAYGFQIRAMAGEVEGTASDTYVTTPGPAGPLRSILTGSVLDKDRTRSTPSAQCTTEVQVQFVDEEGERAKTAPADAKLFRITHGTLTSITRDDDGLGWTLQAQPQADFSGLMRIVLPASETWERGEQVFWVENGRTCRAAERNELASIELFASEVEPAFAAQTTSYTAAFAEVTITTEIIAVPVYEDAELTITPESISGTDEHHYIDLVQGENPMSITVTPADGSAARTYEIMGNKAAPIRGITGISWVYAPIPAVSPVNEGEAITVEADGQYYFIVETDASLSVESVRITITDPEGTETRTENKEPYTSYGKDAGFGRARTLAAGEYVIEATAHGSDHGRGDWLGTHTVSFRVEHREVAPEPEPEPEPEPTALTAIKLVDVGTQARVATLTDGAVIDLGVHRGTTYGFEATAASGASIGSVTFALSGAATANATENKAPYSLYGDSAQGDGTRRLKGAALPAGAYAVTATAYAERNAAGAIVGRRSASFSVLAPPQLDVADAEAEEGKDETIDFVVSVTRSPGARTTVDYATSNGTATAGEDYTATSGTLTFDPGDTSKTVKVPVLDDVHDEGKETLTLTLSNAQGATIGDGVATGTIKNSDAMPKAWALRFGRTVGTQMVEAFRNRTEGGRGSYVQIAGADLLADPATHSEEEAQSSLRLPSWEAPREGEPETGMSLREAMMQSAFQLQSSDEGGGGPTFTAWGRFSRSGFDGTERNVDLDGDVTSAIIGADSEWDRLLAGVMVSESVGDGSYRLGDGTAQGTVQSSLTGIYPYARWRLNDRVAVWALGGGGSGDLTLEPEGIDPMKTELSLRMGAVGIEGNILEMDETSNTRVNLRSDAMWVETRTGRTEGLIASKGDTTRLRIAIDAERTIPMGRWGALMPRGEVGLRIDGGDAETGAGVEVAAGVTYSTGRVFVEGQARTLVAHDEEGYEEWGASVSAGITPNAAGRGLTLSIRPTWGMPGGGAGQVWSSVHARDLVATEDFEAERRLDAEIGYGLRAGRTGGTITPYWGLSLGDAGGRAWRSGARWQVTEGLDLGIEAAGAGGHEGQASRSLMFRASARW